jgi:hypothetical protein
MTKKPIDFDMVQEIALAFPGVEEGMLHRAPTLKVAGRLLTCPVLHKSAEPNSLMVRISFEERAKLLAADPSLYYVTDHYMDYPSVLVRLPEMDRQSLRDLLRTSWQFVTSDAKMSRRKPRGRDRT